MHHSIIIHAIITICLLFLSNAERIFCPPDHFVKNANRSVRGYKTALMFEIHGRLYVSKSDLPLYWAEYHNGGAISRNIYNHVGILGIDKVYISVFYNESLYPTPPTVEDIYPPDKYCVSDWNNLGVIGWRPTPFGGPVENWPLNAKGKPSLDKNLYKSIRGSNIIYEEIKNHTDFVFLLDVDEFLVPVNWNTSIVDYRWCRKEFPPLISRILEQMLITATTSRLESYMVLRNSSRDGIFLPHHQACMMGYTWNFWKNRCVGIESIYMPSYVWLHERMKSQSTIPTIRSKYPAFYTEFMNDEDVDGYAQLWKSVFQTKFNPPMQGMAIHDNPKGTFRVLAPRSYHGRLSLELSHTRRLNYFKNYTHDQKYLMNDTRLVDLYETYRRCSKYP